MSLKGKKILIAISGSIAAYKTPQLVRLMVKAGVEVKVIMTESAKDFVTPLSLSTVSKNPVFSSIQNGDQWNSHVALGRWADLMLVAPASANTMAKMCHGICDNLLLAVYLSAACPVFIAPAMDEDMWKHPATERNIELLLSFGHHIIDTEHGELASGIIGYGRMAEPENILDYLNQFFKKEVNRQALPVKTALITAGPTYEKIDPVRFIGNFSTGKMGIALAMALAEENYQVHLVLGPSSQKVEHPFITVYPVESAQEMFDKCNDLFPEADIAIMAAAVADYRPESSSKEKIKKEKTQKMQINLVKNPDILAHLGKIKKENQFLAGFALETENELENAKSKLKNKHADLIILNSLKDEGSGFGVDTNKVTLIFADHELKELPLQSKEQVARQIVSEILTAHD